MDKINLKELNEKLNRLLEEKPVKNINELFGYLGEDTPDGLIQVDNNKIFLELTDGKLIGRNVDTWTNKGSINVELDIETCKNKKTLLEKLKDLGVFHPETVDISKFYDKDNESDSYLRRCIILNGLVEKDNPKLNIQHGYGVDIILQNDNGDEVIAAITKLGENISSYEKITETSKGTLVACKMRPHGVTGVYFIKDGKADSATTASLVRIIKELLQK